MLRVVGFHLFMFLLPFIVYGFYLYFTRIDPLKREGWEGSPVYWLAIGGLVLTIGSFFAIAMFTGAGPGGTYVPARFEDGQLVPGRFE